MTPEASHEDAWIKFLAWFEVNRKRLLLTFGLVVVAVAVWYLTRLARERSEAAASRQLIALAARTADPAPPAADFLKLAETTGRTQAGKHARLLAAERLFGEGKYAEAQAEFERALAISPEGVLAPQAAYGVAASLDAQDKLAEAEAKYREITVRFPDDAAARHARLALAGLAESRQQPEQAAKLYDELIREARPGISSMEARSRREALVREHPNLAGTNAPAPPAAAPLSLTTPAGR
ncbi:MAG: tetratricopeptide repeat protein [Limisphaerales bacterium]